MNKNIKENKEIKMEEDTHHKTDDENTDILLTEILGNFGLNDQEKIKNTVSGFKNFIEIFTKDVKNIKENQDFRDFVSNVKTCETQLKDVLENINESLDQKDGEETNEKVEEDIDSLVNQYKHLESQIESLSKQQQKHFWATYHEIPVNSQNLNDKIEVIMSSLKTLNSNIVSNFNYEETLENILSEVQILRKEMKSRS